jgi:hypothetical protein
MDNDKFGRTTPMPESFPIYDNLPDEPELAFLYLEDIYYNELKQREHDWQGEEGAPSDYYTDYISKVLAARTELGLDILPGWKRPTIVDFHYGFYQDFRSDVLHYRTSIQIRFGRRNKTYSVRLDLKAKTTIRHYTAKIRQLVQESDLPDKKKKRLLDKLAAFENEVDRDRTRLEAFGAALVELAGFVGEAKERADFQRLTDGIAKILWGSKEEERRELPRTPDRKQIEPPEKAAPKAGSLAEDLDDDIPF